MKTTYPKKNKKVDMNLEKENLNDIEDKKMKNKTKKIKRRKKNINKKKSAQKKIQKQK